jgi:hypothetical protein
MAGRAAAAKQNGAPKGLGALTAVCVGGGCASPPPAALAWEAGCRPVRAAGRYPAHRTRARARTHPAHTRCAPAVATTPSRVVATQPLQCPPHATLKPPGTRGQTDSVTGTAGAARRPRAGALDGLAAARLARACRGSKAMLLSMYGAGPCYKKKKQCMARWRAGGPPPAVGARAQGGRAGCRRARGANKGRGTCVRGTERGAGGVHGEPRTSRAPPSRRPCRAAWQEGARRGVTW